MKKYICAVIAFLTILNNTAFASGMFTSPQSEKDFQIQVPSVNASKNLQKVEPLKTLPTVPPVVTEKPFRPVVEPIRKTEESNKALVAGTSTEVSKYDKISLPEAIKYSMAHNLDIIGTRLNVDMAKNDIKTANRLRNPYLQTFLNSGKAATDNPNELGLIFPIEIAKRGPRKNLAKATMELTKGNVLLAELNLRLEVRQSYVDLVSAKSTLKILNDQKSLLQELLNIAQKKYEAGAVPQMDVIQAKMTLNQLLIQVNSANTDVYVARYKFNILLDPAKSNFDTVEDYLPEQNKFISILTPMPTDKMPTFEQLFDVALKKRIDLQNAEKDIQVAQKNLVVVMRQRVPDIEIGGGPEFVPYQLSTGNETTKGVYIGGSITNIPLLYMYNPEIKNAKLQIEQKQLAYKNLKHEAELNLHSSYAVFITKRDNLNYYNDILLTESKQFLNMAKRSYIVGKSSLTDLIFIEQSYKNIMMGYVNALSDYYDAWVDVLQELNDEDFKMNQQEEIKPHA